MIKLFIFVFLYLKISESSIQNYIYFSKISKEKCGYLSCFHVSMFILCTKIGILVLYRYINLVLCDETEFQCQSGYGCLDKSLLCDAHPQCLHGSDEQGCGT